MFAGSIKEIPDGGTAVPAGRGLAAIVRRTLTGAEDDEPIEFQVAFQMRAFPELLERLGRGELISDAEMAARYYPLESDYEKVATWLTSHGFTITLQDPNRLAIFASGPVALVSAALQVAFARVNTDDGEFTSAVSVPSLPVAEATAILGINGLQPHIRPHKHTRLRLLQPSSLTGNGPPFLPGQIALAYHANGVTVTGAGQKIGIVIDTFPANSDLTSFWTACGVSQSTANVEKVQVVSGTLPATSGEETLDVEWSSSMAPAAKVRIYATKTLSFVNLDKAYQKILTDLPSQPALHQVSLSYGLGETYVSGNQLNTDAQYFASLASAGVTVLVSSGDGGSSPDSTGHSNTGPIQTESPASDPSVTSVGGTSLYVDATTGNTTSESAWVDGGGGVSWYFARPNWQAGSGVPGGTLRLVPDVAAAADLNTGGYLIFAGKAYIVGGTSWSAPVWAGFCALINQSRASAGQPSLGLLGPKIYPLLGSSSFVDITTGNNGANGVYNAGPGYDLCTGIGVPYFSALLQALTPLPPTISAQPQNLTVNLGQPGGFSVTAAGSAPLAYQWQISTDGGNTWTALTNTPTYSGTTAATLQIASAGVNLDGARCRCVVSNAIGSITSNAAMLTVVQPPVITSATTASATFGQTLTYTITASNSPTVFSASGLPAGLTLAPATGIISGTVAAVGIFPVSLGASNAAGTGLATLTLSVNPAAATVTLSNLSQTYDGAPKPVTVDTTPQGLTVAVTYDGSATPPTFAASYAVVATVTDPDYSASASSMLVIVQASQVISFPALPAKTVGDPAFALTATASSGLPVTYQSDNSAVATISGNLVTIVGVGTALITAAQAGDSNYVAAAAVSQTLTVAPASETDASGTPALPVWALAALPLLIFGAAVPRLRGKKHCSSARHFHP